MVQHGDERDGSVSIAWVSMFEGLRSDRDGPIDCESFGRDFRCCFVGFQARDRGCPRHQASHKVPGSAPNVKSVLSFA